MPVGVPARDVLFDQDGLPVPPGIGLLRYG